MTLQLAVDVICPRCAERNVTSQLVPDLGDPPPPEPVKCWMCRWLIGGPDAAAP